MAVPFARKLNPSTGDWTLSAGDFARSSSPAMSAVLLVLRTQKGEALADPELGVDYKAARRATGNRAENLRAAVFAGLARLVARGVIAPAPAVVVRSEALPQGARDELDVTFVDPLTRERATATGVVP